MSIINDALKKTQSDLQNKEKKSPTNVYEKFYQSKKSQISPEEPRQSKKDQDPMPQRPFDSKMLLLLLLLVLAVVVIFIYYPTLPKKLLRKAKSIRVTATQTTPTPPSAVKRDIPKDAIILSGVMVMDDRQVAIINDEVYEVGDFVNGKKIVNITLDQVDLLQNGKIQTYKVRHK